MTLKQALERVAWQYRGKAAIAEGDFRLSYAELDKSSNKIANALIEMGVVKGERVAMLLSNSPEFVITFFGIVKTGAIAVPLDPQYRLDELTVLLNDCAPSALIGETAVLESLVASLPAFKFIKHVIDVGAERDGQFTSYRQMIASGSNLPNKVSPTPEDIALILYTSGPSFSPRGVMLSHRGLVQEAGMLGDGFQQTHKDVVMLYALPMYHVFGLVAVLLAAFVKGCTVVIVPGTGLSISSFMAAIEREKGTMFFAVPYIFALAVDIAEKEGIKSDLSSLRLCSSSAHFLPASLNKRFQALFGFKILDCFALTEAVCHVTCPQLDGKGREGSVGKALPGWEIRIVDDDAMSVPLNQAGEIVIKGPFMAGYYGNPKATAEVIKNGWLHTGDIGRMDEAGNLFIIGRKKDIIIVKGQNIHPGDVEAVLYQHPDVAEAAVVGIPDEMRGEVVGAVVSLKPGSRTNESDIKKLCLERLASYKVPKQIIFFDSLPHSADGKIDKAAVRRKLSLPLSSLRVIIS